MALPDNVTPPKVTALVVPTFLSAKVGALLLTVNTSLPNKPETTSAPVAAVVALYTLLLAVAVITGVPGTVDWLLNVS